MADCQETTMRIVASGSIVGGCCYNFFDCGRIRLRARQTGPSRVSGINDLRKAGGCRNNRSIGLSKLRECAARQKGYSGRLDRARNNLAIEQTGRGGNRLSRYLAVMWGTRQLRSGGDRDE